MQNLIFSLNATLPVFLVMVVGYALGQLGFLPPAFCKASDRLTFKVTLPLMLFLDMGSVDILHDFRPRFVLFCFAATLVGILTVWAGAKRFLKDKTLVGEFVQAGYRSSAAVLGVAFIQNIYGSAGMAPLMILGSVPLFNIFAVLILMLESPEQRGLTRSSSCAAWPQTRSCWALCSARSMRCCRSRCRRSQPKPSAALRR